MVLQCADMFWLLFKEKNENECDRIFFLKLTCKLITFWDDSLKILSRFNTRTFSDLVQWMSEPIVATAFAIIWHPFNVFVIKLRSNAKS